MWADEVDKAFAGDVDYAQLVKVYGIPNDGEKRYSPAQCLGCESHTVTGSPDPKHISTSYVERQNPTMRMSMRRFTRLTNAFSKKMENHMHAVALDFMYYNFARVHQTLKCTPAMAAGLENANGKLATSLPWWRLTRIQTDTLPNRRVHWRVAPAIPRGGTEDQRGRAKSHAANTLRTPLAKSPFPKEPFTRFASFFSAPQPPPSKPLPTSPAESVYRFRPSAALDLSRATQPTRHFGKAAQTTEINRSYLRLSVFICG